MKGLMKLFLAVLLVGGMGVSCTSNDNEPQVEDRKIVNTTEQGSLTAVLAGMKRGGNGKEYRLELNRADNSYLYINNHALKGSNFTFAGSSAQRLDAMKGYDRVEEWAESLPIKEGTSAWVRFDREDIYIFYKIRFIGITGDKVNIEYKLEGFLPQGTESSPSDSSKDEVTSPSADNKNANARIPGREFTSDLSMPHIDARYLYVEHKAALPGGKKVFNYAVEWNSRMKHSVWVAFSFNSQTKSVNHKGRSDNWGPDPLIPNMGVSEWNHKADGFDKGHLVASQDRQFSEAANGQTYYYSNISPQFSSFNQGIWAAMEQKVQQWSRNVTNDGVYIAKGGTLDKLLINFSSHTAGSDHVYPVTDGRGYTKKNLPCPKYYYMAVLMKVKGKYQAMAFWIEHRDDYGFKYGDRVPADVLKKYAISVEQLQKNTDIDFFCNLPDDIENKVEAEYCESDWSW